MTHFVYSLVGRVMFWIAWPLIWVYAPFKLRARVLVVCGNEFLGVKSYFGSGEWQLPGGGVHSHETLTTAVVRELYEETGIRVGTLLLSELLPPAIYKELGLRMRYAIFYVELPDKPPILAQPREIQAVSWLPINGASKLSVHVRQAVGELSTKHPER